PSPEMVAAAGDQSGLSALAGTLLFSFIVAALVTVALLSDHLLVAARLPIDKTADALEDRARDIAARLGYNGGADHSRGVFLDGDLLGWVRRRRAGAPEWDDLRSTRAFSAVSFYYRMSPVPLVPLSTQWAPT